MNIAVGLYATAVTARKPGAIRLYRETNEQVRSKTRTFHTQTGSLLLPSEIKKAQVRSRAKYQANLYTSVIISGVWFLGRVL